MNINYLYTYSFSYNPYLFDPYQRPRKFQWYLKKVSSVFQENFKKKFQECFNEVFLAICNFLLLLYVSFRSYPSRRRACCGCEQTATPAHSKIGHIFNMAAHQNFQQPRHSYVLEVMFTWMRSVLFWRLPYNKQAGADLCQAQGKLRLVEL